MSKSVAMKDIAEALDLSIVSVSKALAGKDGVSEEMRQRVILKAKELGYQYGAAASKKSAVEQGGNIGILVADHFFEDNAFYTKMYREVLMHCTAEGYTGILEIVSIEAEKSGTMPMLLSAQKVDGVIFLGEFAEKYIERVLSTKIPYMLLDFYNDEQGADSVVSDGVYGSFQLTNHLVQCGHKNIGFIGNRLATSSIMDRYLGYYKALLKEGLLPREDWVIPDRDDHGKLIPIVLPQEMPTAFVCNCDEVAYYFVQQLQKAGYRVPEDVSITGFDDFRFATMSEPPITTFRVDMKAMADAAVRQLVRKIMGKHVTSGRTIVSGSCVYRKSEALVK